MCVFLSINLHSYSKAWRKRKSRVDMRIDALMHRLYGLSDDEARVLADKAQKTNI